MSFRNEYLKMECIGKHSLKQKLDKNDYSNIIHNRHKWENPNALS